MSNQRKYFTFILTTLCIMFIGFGLFIYIPGLNMLSRPGGQVLGVKEIKAPDMDPFVDKTSVLDYSGKNIELRLNIDSKNKLLVNLPLNIKNQTVERDSKQFYIPCGNQDTNVIQIDFASGISTAVKSSNIKIFLNIKQSVSSGNCKLSNIDTAKILDNIEIRSFDFDFIATQATSVLNNNQGQYILSGNCISNGQTKDQMSKYTQTCSLWSLGKDGIYPDLVSSRLREWFPAGDISFYNDPTTSTQSSSNDIPFKLINIDAVKREANIFYIKNDNLKLLDFREVKDISQFSKDFTSKVIALPDSGLSDYFYRKNQLPIISLPKTSQTAGIPKQTISCFWTSMIQDEFWYRESLPTLPLTRSNPCNIGPMVVTQKVNNLKISPEELSSGDAWFLDKNAIDFNQTIFDSVKDLGYNNTDPKELCLAANPEKLFFVRQICPFSITSTEDLNNLNSKLETVSQKVGKWKAQQVAEGDSSYQVYTNVNDNGLWVYWFKLVNDSNLNEKKLELDRIMEKVALK